MGFTIAIIISINGVQAIMIKIKKKNRSLIVQIMHEEIKLCKIDRFFVLKSITQFSCWT